MCGRGSPALNSTATAHHFPNLTADSRCRQSEFPQAHQLDALRSHSRKPSFSPIFGQDKLLNFEIFP
jgi:hypothetical protein